MKAVMVRESHVVYSLIRLPTTAGHWLLLRRHEKWRDWSLVGGHVEEWERDDWRVAAAREANEEMPPLVCDKDFVVVPIHDKPITWGPEASRSAQGKRTIYHIRYYSVTFLHDPVMLLSKLDPHKFLLVDELKLAATPHALGNPVHRARTSIRGGFSAVPPAWNKPIALESLPAALRHVTSDGVALG